MSVRINSMEQTLDSKRESKLAYWMVGIIAGLVFCFLLIFAIKTIKILVKVIIQYWWVAILIVFGILILRKLFGRKKHD